MNVATLKIIKYVNFQTRHAYCYAKNLKKISSGLFMSTNVATTKNNDKKQKRSSKSNLKNLTFELLNFGFLAF